MPGNIEVSISNNGWNGDCSQDATGDVVLAIDVDNNPIASEQRMYRLFMTNPGDDIVSSFWGGGLRKHVGKNITSNLIGEIEYDLIDSLQVEDTLVNDPPPSVTVQNMGNSVVQIGCKATSKNGYVVTVPAFPLSLAGGA